VENNNAFYRMPSKETFEACAERTAPGFVMAVKASRYLTHVRRLKPAAVLADHVLAHAASGTGDDACLVTVRIREPYGARCG
jgi:uncharacterized protein YecE (DUF72 family)